jgi:hypothetical protein
MEANELRTGNIISCNYGTGTVDVINNELQSVVVIMNPKSAYDMLSRCNGIPLTEAWLDIFGLNKEIVDADQNFYRVNEMADDDDNIYWKFYRNNEGLSKLQYVHQLQNLYFALTGEELTIKEPAV